MKRATTLHSTNVVTLVSSTKPFLFMSTLLVCATILNTMSLAQERTAQEQDQKKEDVFPPSLSLSNSNSQQDRFNDVELATDRSWLKNKSCRVQLISEIDVPALEAGMISKLWVKENDVVQSGLPVAELDATNASIQKQIAEKNRDVAKVDAENKNRIDFARQSLKFANDIYEKKRIAFQDRAINYIDFKESEFQKTQANLQLNEANTQQTVAQKKLELETVNIAAATELISRHQVKSMIDGQVAEIYSHRGEWVNKGDKVMRIIQMNKLQINGRANSKEIFPGEIANKNVVVSLELPNKQVETFNGKVVRIKLENSVSDMYFFVVEVENRKLNGFWLLRPNSNVDIKVLLK